MNSAIPAMTFARTLGSLATLSIAVFSGSVVSSAEIDFNRDVRPILSDKCYFCHGPDEDRREADVRFDTFDGATDSIESGEFMDRVLSDDPDMIMPKPESHLSLSDKEKQTLKNWVESGTGYDQHWAFVPLSANVDVPSVANAEWPRQELDHFVLAKLDSEGLQPSEEADSLRWLRRITFDLTGLPPTVAEVEAFSRAVAGDREAAYRKTVDALLASLAFGEHMSVAWLDSARYADSYGYQSDKLNTQWPYRDWVVKAFNSNLPYDQFLTWQLAGDLLENPSRDQRLATAFNRIHRLNNEGGAVFEEWRIENVADRVHTFGTAVLGLTFECCRCHDHKYDPIPTRDYYSLSAFFNSIDENGLYDRTEKVPSPTMLLPTVEQANELQSAEQRLRAARQTYDEAVKMASQRFESGAWSAEALQTEADRKELADRALLLDFDQPFDKSMKDTFFPSSGDRHHETKLNLVDFADAKIRRPSPHDGPRKALNLDGEQGVTTKDIEPFDRWLPFSLAVTFRETKRAPQSSVIAHHTRGTDAGYNGWDLMIADGHLESKLYRVWPGNGMGVRTVEPIPVDQWYQLTATYDGSSTATGLKIFLDGKQLETTVMRDGKMKSANVLVDHGGELVIGQRFRDRGLAGGLIADVRLIWRELTKTEIKWLANDQPLEVDADYAASVLDADAKAAREQLIAAHKAVVMAEEAMNEIPIMIETETVRPAHVLARGAYDAPTSEETRVTRETPQNIGPEFPADAPVDRLGLAQWVTDPSHPLTGRVIVNRLWSNFFGAGLVRTPENFGLQGELPTHPELLDWLSRDFIDNGWDIKRFCRSIALSSTYRQDSRADQESIERDSDNRLLARGPAYRLAAEQIRDLSLAASGLMNRDSGGPPVSPYQAGGDLWKESNSMSPSYQQSVGKALYRRSLYSVWKRTAPLPNMMAFDTSSREVCTVARSRTNTPLQALVLLNDVQFVEAARVLAENVLRETDDDVNRIKSAFVALTGRTPDAIEADLLAKMLAEERVHYRDSTEAAELLIKHGESEPDPQLDIVDLAAMTNVCQAILNLDATVWKR